MRTKFYSSLLAPFFVKGMLKNKKNVGGLDVLSYNILGMPYKGGMNMTVTLTLEGVLLTIIAVLVIVL